MMQGVESNVRGPATSNDRGRKAAGEFRGDPSETLLHSLIEEAVRRFPDTVALECEEHTLTYAGLNSRANRLARVLRARGVGPDVPVGVCVDRSLEMSVALLGILKAGGAYVPLDPDYPVARLRTMLESSAPPVVLAQDHLLDRLDEIRVPVFRLGRDWPEADVQDDSDLPPLGSPADLAYIIYTSGSTGVPKGVMNSHRGICNRLLWMQDAYRLTPDDRVLQKTPFSFDVSVWELFWPLLVGARLVFARPGGHRDPNYLASLIRDAGITVLHFVPSMLRLFLESTGLESSCVTLRHVFASGEGLPEDLARRCLERIPARLHNLYGPTEAAVDVTFYECRRDDPPGPIPIGRPIANMRTYVLDEDLQPLPVGVEGELFLSGVGVARGYLGQPELTAERFIADPFSPQAGAKMYRTGDLARWRTDGELEFLGRLDHQVKIRGFRIELGEIETALTRIEGVRQVVVAAQEWIAGDTRLVAYLVGGDGLIDAALREGLARSLPEYMVPAIFVRLGELPLTPSGKVDRKALPVPVPGRNAGVDYVAPETALEKSLAEIWGEVLGLEQVGIHDNFFALGGQSLLAIRIVARASANAGVEIPLRALFESPTIAGMSAAIASLRDLDELEPITAISADKSPPVSFAQQRMWFLDRLEGSGLSAYNIATATLLEGWLEADAFRRAFEDVVARHEPLRTTFALREGQPRQVIQAPGPVEFSIDDLRHPDSSMSGVAVDRLIREEAARPFDLAAGPVIRARLLRTDEQRQILVLTVHHIAADGWSLTVFWREFAEAYKARIDGRSPEFPALRFRYADYAAWQRRLLDGDRMARSMGYWREQLSGLEPTELPGDRPRPAIPSYRGDRLAFDLPGATVDRLRGLCRDVGVTPHMALLSAFQATLGRITGRDDVVVGTPVAGRSRPELEGLIGFFVNTLIFRADLSGNPSFRDLLKRTLRVSLDAHEHQDVPFERLVEELQPERRRNRNPLVQVGIQYLEPGRPDFSGSGLTATPLPNPESSVRFDIEIEVRPAEDCLAVEINFATDLFDRASIERLAGRYRSLLEAALADPDLALEDIAIVTDSERELMLGCWNDTATELPSEETVHALFSKCAAASPDAPALIFGESRVSYEELDSRSDRLAHGLRSLGARAETVVAFCLPRSPDQIVAMLGILKAGAAFLPLDPANPPDRNAYILQDAKALALVTNEAMIEVIPRTEIPTVRFEEAETGTCDPSSRLPSEAGGRSLAYVMYTSGSTGEPKGVMVEHRSIVRLVHGQEYATFGPDRAFLQLASVAFDASTFEVWGALLHGARLVIAPEGPLDLPLIGDLIRAHGVTTLWLTAGLFNEIVDARVETLRGVREILTGGEALSTRHVRLALDRLGPEVRIINGYGPTECTTFACCHPIPHEDPAPGGTIPIGRPIANTRAYVLDERGRLAPIGTTGELYLGGLGVARGYLGRPDLGADRFLDDPFAAEPGARMYRTGDLARWRSDGTLEFLGRIDGQVKLRGFRIELGEIEALLARHKDVARCAVIVEGSDEAHRGLAAYWCPASESDQEDPDLAGYLSALLPRYMVPSTFTRVETFPLTSNGKIDRKRLARPGTPDRPAQRPVLAPRDPIEANLASLWSRHLKIPEPGIREDFFRLGGHSLLAISLLSSIESEMGYRVSIASLFEHPTIEGLARVLRSGARRPARPVATRLLHGETGPALVFLPSVYGHCSEGLTLSGLLPASLRAFGLSVQGDEVLWDNCHSLSDMARGYIEALLEAAPEGPYVLVGYSFGGRLGFEMARILVEMGKEVAQLVIIDTEMYHGPRRLRDRIVRDLPSMVANLPAKLRIRLLPATRDLLRRTGRSLSQRNSSDVASKTRFRASGLKDEELDRLTLSQLYRQRLEASMDAFLAYAPGVYRGDALLLRCKVRPLFHWGEADLGWGPWIAGRLTVRTLPGHHHILFKEPSIHTLAGEIVSLLERLEA